MKGDIVVIGGSLKLDGQGTGNAVVIGGLVSMGAKASVGGDMVTVGGSLQRAEGSQIGGNVVTNLPPPTINLPVAPKAEIPPVPPSPKFESWTAWDGDRNLLPGHTVGRARHAAHALPAPAARPGRAGSNQTTLHSWEHRSIDCIPCSAYPGHPGCDAYPDPGRACGGRVCWCSPGCSV